MSYPLTTIAYPSHESGTVFWIEDGEVLNGPMSIDGTFHTEEACEHDIWSISIDLGMYDQLVCVALYSAAGLGEQADKMLDAYHTLAEQFKTDPGYREFPDGIPPVDPLRICQITVVEGQNPIPVPVAA